ncbi:MAG TPA: peptidase domain-containing ABC transporter [Chitinophagales bacterium]|nr:peptidase domain-containing ABC transporter [Chitinophagales bacterium]
MMFYNTLKFNRNKFVHQLESTDCGPACIVMVAYHFGGKYTLTQIKDICEITRMGVSVQDIIDGAKKINFNTTALKLTIEDLEQIPLPSILYWKQEHFIVLRQIKNNNVYIIDDPAYGRVKMSQKDFVSEWIGNNNCKGIAIVLEPNGELTKIDTNKPNRVSESLKLVFNFINKNKIKYTIAILLLFVALACNWAIPIFFQKTIDNGIVNKSIQIITYLLLAQFVLFISHIISDTLSHILLVKVNFHLSILLQNSFLSKLIKLPINYFDTKLNTDTLQRISDQHIIQEFTTWKGIELFINTLNIIIFGGMLLSINYTIFNLFIFLSLISIFWTFLFLKSRANLEYSIFIQQSLSNNNMYEFIMNMPEIKINGAQNNLINKIKTIQQKLNNLELKSLSLNTYQVLGTSFINKALEIIAIAISAYFIIESRQTLGQLLSISYILGQLSSPIRNIINFTKDLQDALISKNRLDEVYNEQNEDNENKIINFNHHSNLIMRDVSFKYPGSFNSFVLKNIDLIIPKNKKTAIVGVSGSGKTTLIKLLLKYYDIQNGELLLGSENVNLLNAEKWRELCGIVLQDGSIFSGTIIENIAFSDDTVNIDKIKKATKTACIDKFIESLPLQYNTKIGNIGIQLSGGQKQRILIARAIYKNPDFLFFDEATSALDAKNEKEITDNLEQFFKNKTVVIVAHRLSTVKNADQIVVLDGGEIVETGTHEQLVKNKAHYFNLVSNQLELGN